MKLSKHLKNESGFTLVELLVIGAVLAVLMVGFASFMFQQSRSQKNQEIQQNATQLKNNVIDAASQPETISHSEQLSFPTN